MYSGVEINKIDIDDSEILRYLGYGGQELADKLRLDIFRCKEIVLEQVRPRFVCAGFKLDKTDGGIKLKSTTLVLTGNDIVKLLENSDGCVLMAATIGGEVEKAITYHQKISIADGVIMDAIATAAIEAVCDELERQLRKIHLLTQRYSCGYGDLPVELQPKILSALNTQKSIGLFCNEANIMIPRKSVTAIMGILEQSSDTADKCAQKDCTSCLYSESCILKKGGRL